MQFLSFAAIGHNTSSILFKSFAGIIHKKFFAVYQETFHAAIVRVTVAVRSLRLKLFIEFVICIYFSLLVQRKVAKEKTPRGALVRHGFNV